MATRLATILVIVIVGATFIAGLIVGAQRDDANGPIDLIIVNGKVYPGGGAAVQEAVAVRGNQILRVGSNRDVKRLRRPQTVVVDAHGAAVLPGLNDAHVQLVDGALELDRLDLSAADTLNEITTQVADYAEDMPTRTWVLGRNASGDLFATANVPARKLLDEAVPDRPVLLTSDDGKLAWANSEALKKAGINRRTRAPQPGTIVKDRRTGEPTGVLKAPAMDLLTQVLPQPSHAEKLLALRDAIDEAHKLGVTSLQSISRNEEELDLLREIREQGDLTVRVYGSLAVSEDIDDAAVAALDKLRQEYPDDPTLKLGGVEIVCQCDPVKLQRAVELLDKHNWHVMVRASDETAVHAALDAFEHAMSANPSPSRDRRYRIEDIEGVMPDDLARLPRFGLIAEPFEDEVAQVQSPLLNSLAGAGVRVLFGSNWPMSPLDPRAVIEDALNGGAESQLKTVLDAYTAQAAYASFDEQRKGRLAPGMLADIVILSNDIFQNPARAVKETSVAVTIFDGKVVYQRPTAAASN